LHSPVREELQAEFRTREARRLEKDALVEALTAKLRQSEQKSLDLEAQIKLHALQVEKLRAAYEIKTRELND
jgi:hypothetical protein